MLLQDSIELSTEEYILPVQRISFKGISAIRNQFGCAMWQACPSKLLRSFQRSLRFDDSVVMSAPISKAQSPNDDSDDDFSE